jgi:hypothetical protein
MRNLLVIQRFLEPAIALEAWSASLERSRSVEAEKFSQRDKERF